MAKDIKAPNDRIEVLYQKLVGHIEQARMTILTTLDTEMVKAYWCIGRDLVEEEQKGAQRATYGQEIVKIMSERLSRQYQKGFGTSTLKDIRQFYQAYSQPDSLEKSHTLCGQSSTPPFRPNLGWSHYRLLMRVKRPEARSFYEVEASKNQWSSRELARQINTLLFDRLAMSKDQTGMLKLAKEGQEVQIPSDAIKDPLVLEFLGIPQHHTVSESKLESIIITHMQQFLLELGKGFAFVARQKRILLDGKSYYPDLIFYHTILKCYFIVDIKVNELSHGDVGQMLFYVNYFNKEWRTEGDGPTIGLILCTDKSDSMVQYTLEDKAKQIFASKYQFHLPTEDELKQELKRELEEIKDQKLIILENEDEKNE